MSLVKMAWLLRGLCCGLLLTAYTLTGVAIAQNNDMVEQLKIAFEAGELDDLHAVLVLKDGATFAEAYFSGEDQNWGRSLGVRQFDADSLHDLRSVTKSITGLLYGIALAEGKVPDVQQSLIAQFPEYPELQADEKRKDIRIEDALTMRMGTEWNENLSYTDPKNSEIAMEWSEDRFRYVLDRAMLSKPGTSWNYNGGATAIIARLIEKGVGKPLDEYANEKLFKPLGIKTYEWAKGADGAVSAASGLRLSARGLASIGQMILDDGRHADTQIVPSKWLQACFTPHANKLNGPFNYGYFWWLAKGHPPAFVTGLGNGGQRLSINKTLGLVFVVFAGKYNQPDAWRVAVKVSTEFLTPALQR